MFEQLHPILADGRKVHIVLAAASDGKIIVYIEPGKAKDDEDATFSSPFRVTDTPAALDATLPSILADWVKTRHEVTSSIQTALDAATDELKKRADDAKKAITSKVARKTPTVTPGKASKQSVAPTHSAVVPPPSDDANTGNTSNAAEGAPIEASDVQNTIVAATVTTAAPQENLF